MASFKINAIDHVAINVKDLDASIQWYAKVLGLRKVQPEAWKPFPIFMMKAKFGVALFPAKDSSKKSIKSSIRIDHFAFNVDPDEFLKAQVYFASINEHFQFQDHTYFHSIYLSDPDGHTVELTTLMVGEDFYHTH